MEPYRCLKFEHPKRKPPSHTAETDARSAESVADRVGSAAAILAEGDALSARVCSGRGKFATMFTMGVKFFEKYGVRSANSRHFAPVSRHPARRSLRKSLNYQGPASPPARHFSVRPPYPPSAIP